MFYLSWSTRPFIANNWDSTLYEHRLYNGPSPQRNGKLLRPSSAVLMKKNNQSHALTKPNVGGLINSGYMDDGLSENNHNSNLYHSSKIANLSSRSRPTTTTIQQSRTNPMFQSTKNRLRSEEVAQRVRISTAEMGTEFSQIQKTIPRNISVEKERLYGDTLLLKQSINSIQAENMKLKTKIVVLERENMKLIKTIGSLTNGLNNDTIKNSDSFLLVALKKQVKEIKDMLIAKEQELEELKRTCKVTRLQELEAQLTIYNEELIKQKQIINHLGYSDNIPFGKVYEDQESMLLEINRLQDEVKFLEDQNQNYQVARELNLKQLQRLQTDCEKLKRQVKEKDKEIERLQHSQRLETAYSRKSPSPNGIEKNNNSLGEEEEFKRLIRHKDIQLAQQEKTINDLMTKLQEKTTNEAREKQMHMLELNKQKEAFAELEMKYRTLLYTQNEYELSRTESKANHTYNRFEEELPTESKDKITVSENKFRKFRKVTFNDVKDIGYELNVRLRLKKIEYDQIDQEFFGNKESKGAYSITEIKEILKNDPFNLKDEEQLLLVARYLIESNEEEYVLLDLNRSNDIVMIRSVLKKLIGPYAILDGEAENKMIEEVGGIVTKYEDSLRGHYNYLSAGKSKYLTSQQIKMGFKVLDIAITPKQAEFLLMKLYESTGDFKKIEYMKMFEIFRKKTENPHNNESS